jgi:DNA-binding SARP family transcriptional activator
MEYVNMFTYLRTLAAEQLQTLKDRIRIVVIHPCYIQQHSILEEFLEKPGIYVRFDGMNLSEAQMRAQLEAALETQTGSTQLDGQMTLILDEYDRASSSTLSNFLKAILQEAASSRLIIFSREIPRCVLDDAPLRQQTSFIPHDEAFMLWDYARQSTDVALLEVRSFGEGRVLLNGKGVDNWDGMLPRSLFFYLVDRGMTTRNEIFETFWPNLSTREATNVFHVTKRKISEVLGIDLTKYWSGFYRISPEIHLSYDAINFTEMIQKSAIAPPDEAIEQLTRAISLYQGHFLSANEMEWVKRRREELYQNYGEALGSLAQAREEKGDKRHALGLYLRAVATNQQREDLVTNVMQLYRELDMRQDALAVYERLEEELKNGLGVVPASQLQDLASAIRSEAGNHSV